MNRIQTHRKFGWSLLVVAMALIASQERVVSQTLVSGNVSGEWSAKNSPYVVIDNCTVPSGQKLTIRPGVSVWIGENLSITANGLIQAVGTPIQRITFQAPINSQYWRNISLIHESGTNRFKYCDFKNANTALKMSVTGWKLTMNVEVMNCRFSNCFSQAILGEGQGAPGLGLNATLNPVITNCIFNNTSNGCVMNISGGYGAAGGTFGPGLGSADTTIIGNIFQDLAGSALLMNIGNYAESSRLIFVNNTVVNCRTGVDSREPWDAKIQDNIFVFTATAVKTTGALSRTASFNCFFKNTADFNGYPSTYGKAILKNRNGTSCDLLFNIFSDPQFISATDFRLTPGSPCIDAGAPGESFNDVCFPPSQGTEFNDMGAYGGPPACGWVSNEPPAIAPIPGAEVNEEQLLTFNVTATDPDLPPQALSFSLVNPPDGASIDPLFGIFSWVPSEAQGPGTYPITVQVHDDNKPTNGVALTTFSVKVNEVNKPPVIDPIERKTIQAGTLLSFAVTALDGDRPVLQHLTCSLEEPAPPGARFSPDTCVFEWTPTPEQAMQEHKITVRVADDGSPPLSSTLAFIAGPKITDAGPTHLSLTRSNTGTLQLVIDAGPTGIDYTIQATVELQSSPVETKWTFIKTVHPDQLPFTFDDPSPSTLPTRFYRVLRAP